jgi:hypothetical protein
MGMEIIWDQLGAAEWQNRLDGAGHWGLQQSWHYGAAMQAHGAKVGRAQIGGVAMVQVVQRGGLRLVHQGPVWLAPLGQGQKRAVLRRLARCAQITVATPQTSLAGFGMVPLITARTHALWHLDRADLRAGLHGKWRNRLLKAESLLRPAPLKDEKSLRFLIAQEGAQRLARGYKALPGEMALGWADRLVMGWRAGGAVQAGMVFLVHGSFATYHLAWASATARAAFAHGPILWQAALALRARGVTRLDLGEVNTEAGAALARFKLGTGAQATQIGATALILPG